jgi:CHAT domain-containing protein
MRYTFCYFLIALLFYCIKTHAFTDFNSQIDSLVKLGQWQLAEQEVLKQKEKAASLYDDKSVTLYTIQLAELLNLAGGSALAIRTLDKNCSYFKKNTDTLLLIRQIGALADAYLSVGELANYKSLIDSLSSILRHQQFFDSDQRVWLELRHARFFLESVNYERMLFHVHKARSLVPLHPSDSDLSSWVYLYQGYAYHQFKQFEKALLYYDSALITYHKSNSFDNYLLQKIYHRRGNTYSDLAKIQVNPNLSMAIANYDSAISLLNHEATSEKTSLMFFLKFFVHYRSGNLQEALLWIDQALSSLSPDFNIEKPDFASYRTTVNDQQFLLFVVFKAVLLDDLYQQHPIRQYLEQSLLYFKYYFFLHALINSRDSFSLENARAISLYYKENLDRYIKKIYQQQNYFHDEKHLIEAFCMVNFSKYRYTFGDRFASEEKQSMENYLTHKALAEQQQLSAYFSTVRNYSINSIQFDHHIVPRQFEEYSTFVHQLAAQLDSNQSILDYYFVNKSENAFAFVLSKNTIELVDLPGVRFVKDHIDSMINTLKTNDVALYHEIGQKVYDLLIDPVSYLIDDKKHLIILQHKYIHKLPFEALPAREMKKSPKSFAEMRFFIQDKKISYSPALHLLKVNSESHSIPIVAFSPDFSSTLRLTDLYFSKNMIVSLSKLYNGIFKTSKQATIENLYKVKHNPHVFHISSHMELVSEFPEESKLYFYAEDRQQSYIQPFDVLKLPFRAAVTVIGACKSGVGKDLEGEGILSFATYFLKHGSSSVLTTRWDVDDRYSSLYFEWFYQELFSGRPLYEAVHQASIRLLESNEIESRNPLNWAGYYLYGNHVYTPLEIEKGKVWRNPLLLAFLLLIPLIIYYMRYERHKLNSGSK